MDAELGPNSRLVTFTGEGHGQTAGQHVRDRHRRRPCSSTGPCPSEGTVCDPDPDDREAELVGRPARARRCERLSRPSGGERGCWASPRTLALLRVAH